MGQLQDSGTGVNDGKYLDKNHAEDAGDWGWGGYGKQAGSRSRRRLVPRAEPIVNSTTLPLLLQQYVPLFLAKEDLDVAVQSAYKQRNATQIKLYRDKANKFEDEYNQVGRDVLLLCPSYPSSHSCQGLWVKGQEHFSKCLLRYCDQESYGHWIRRID